MKEILNPERHPNRITGSKVPAILLNGWILPINGDSSGLVFREIPIEFYFFEDFFE